MEEGQDGSESWQVAYQVCDMSIESLPLLLKNPRTICTSDWAPSNDWQV